VPTAVDVPAIVRRHVPDAAVPIELANSLGDLGLDSMSLVNLLLDLEESAGIVFPPEYLSDTTFATVESLARAVEELVAEGREPGHQP